MSVLRINGKETSFDQDKIPATIAELLSILGVDSATVVAEVDGRIIERDKFTQTVISSGQSIELVRFVPGG